MTKEEISELSIDMRVHFIVKFISENEFITSTGKIAWMNSDGAYICSDYLGVKSGWVTWNRVLRSTPSNPVRPSGEKGESP